MTNAGTMPQDKMSNMSFFDLRRQVIVRESPSVRLRKAARGETLNLSCQMELVR